MRRGADPLGVQPGAGRKTACAGREFADQPRNHLPAGVHRQAPGGELWRQLRCQKPYRKRYGSGQERRGVIPNRVSIEQRPAIVEERSRLGDWEGDTVIGKNHRGALVTLAERKSRHVLASPVPSKHADGVTAAITRLLRPHRHKCHTLTLEQRQRVCRA